MDVPINADVFCGNQLAGRSTAVIVDPVKQQITHLVVRERALPHTEYVAAIELVTTSSPHEIHLRCGDLGELAPFHSTDYLTSDLPFGDYMPGHYLMWPYVTSGSMVIPVEHEHVPEGELVVHRGARVSARDGHVGRVDEFVVDPHNDHITHLVLQKGHLWGKRDVTIPVAEIDRIEDDHVYLKLDKEAVAALPAVPVRRHVLIHSR